MMNPTSKFIDPLRRRTRQIRWASTAAVGVFGAIVLFQSYSMTGMAMDWRVSAGVAALSFSCISLLGYLSYPPGVEGIARRWKIAAVFFLAGAAALYLVTRQKSEWAQDVLLESGVGCLFIAGIELYLGAIRTSALEEEREESAFYDELALNLGYALDLKLWEYKAMREALDYAVMQGKGGSFVERAALLLQYARRAKGMPEELFLLKDPKYAADIARELSVAELTTAAAMSYGLTDDEYRYLAAVINTRSDPSREQGPIEPALLPKVVNNSAELIVRKRRGVLKRLMFWEFWDPLAAKEELEARAKRVPPRMFDALSRDETAGENVAHE